MKFSQGIALVGLVSLAACSGGGTMSSSVPGAQQIVPQAVTASAQAQARVAMGKDSDKGKKDKDFTNYAGQVTGCSGPDPACVGAFTIALDKDGNAISGTWTQDFTNPTAHDQGTFTGTMTSATTFTATFVSPQDAPCTLNVMGTLTKTDINATYNFNTTTACNVVGGGTLTLHVTKGKDKDKGDKDND